MTPNFSSETMQRRKQNYIFKELGKKCQASVKLSFKNKEKKKDIQINKNGVCSHPKYGNYSKN